MSRASESILSGSSRENGSISKPGTWDRALAISLDRPGGESPVEREGRIRMRVWSGSRCDRDLGVVKMLSLLCKQQYKKV